MYKQMFSTSTYFVMVKRDSFPKIAEVQSEKHDGVIFPIELIIVIDFSEIIEIKSFDKVVEY